MNNESASEIFVSGELSGDFEMMLGKMHVLIAKIATQISTMLKIAPVDTTCCQF